MAIQEFTPTELQNEEWRFIAGYKTAYQVSNLGRVRRTMSFLQYEAGRLLGHKIEKKGGYVRVWLAKNGNSKLHLLHRLVAAAFIETHDPTLHVNHEDGNKQNNRASNLSYVTPKQNQQHASRMGLIASGLRHGSRTHPEALKRGEENGGAKLTWIQVAEIRVRLAKGETGRSLAKAYGVGDSSISRINRGTHWKHS